MAPMSTFSVGTLADLAGVSVRTLHHYDEIGLLPAPQRTPSGYRLYDDRSVDQLQLILTYRSLGLGLDDIAAVLDDASNVHETLRRARARVAAQISHLQTIEQNLTRTLNAKGQPMTPEEKLQAFGDFDPDEHAAEAEERWGGTEAYAQSAQRTASYGPTQWAEIQAEANGLYQHFNALASGGASADSPEAVALVEAHQAHISRWFYECTPEIHAGLGQMYAADERFAKNIDKAGGQGTAAFMSAAIAAHWSG